MPGVNPEMLFSDPLGTIPDDETRWRRKPRLYQDMCDILKVVGMALLGCFGPGTRSMSGELLNTPGPLALEMRENDGVLALSWPISQEVRAVRVATKIGPRWLLVCRVCGKGCRRLYLPSGVAAPFACRHCYGLAYRTRRRADAHDASRQMADVRSLRANLDALEMHARLTMAEARAAGFAAVRRAGRARG